MAKYLVTGAAGFIGSNIAETILKNGDHVIGFDNLETGKMSNIDSLNAYDQFSFVKGDIREYSACLKVCEGVDYVLHQAALGSVPRSIKNPEMYNEVNIGGTFNMLQAAKESQVSRFVFASSSSVYGDTPVLPKVETMVPRPKSPYAISKITGEYYCKVFNDIYELPTVAFRYFNVFGPRQDPDSQYAAVIPKFVSAYLTNQSPLIHGDGEQTRDFTYIENVVNINLAACHAPLEACGRAYNVGCGSRISINELASKVAVCLDVTIKPDYGPRRAGDVKDSLADTSLAETYLPKIPKVTLDEGLPQTVRWFKDAFERA